LGIKDLIIDSVYDQYIRAIIKPRTLYALVTPIEIITHLVNTHGPITTKDRTDNEKRMKTAWHKTRYMNHHSVNAKTGITEDQINKIITSAINYLNNNNKFNHNNDINNNNRRRNTKPKAQALIDGIPVTYCWLHGITQNLYHNSCNCKRKKDGHKDEATYNNRMGGSNVVLSECSSKNDC